MSEKTVLGLRYTDLDRQDILALLLSRAKERVFTAVFTPNAVIAAEAAKDAEKKAVLEKADCLIADGAGLLLASRLEGSPLSFRNTGIDTAYALLPLAEKEGLRLFLYGATRESVKRAKEKIEERFPNLTVACLDGYSEDPSARILLFRPHLLYVCLGFPKQERFILSLKGKGDFVAMGLGGSFDVWSGQRKRAPLFLQRAGLEWLWRTVGEPQRLARLLPLPRFFWQAWRQRWRKNIQKPQKTKKTSPFHRDLSQN
ncbi:MAG: WecB/TagA/CpsF family glycosyltransferase [Clostridia bacterium]|nr:WecB/TagA/CpsF family glycosyltransferase [Clostridia bacterium]